MIGLSFSSCIKSIVAGEVKIENVTKIVARTRLINREALDHEISDQRQSLWAKNPDECERVARELFAKGKVVQPRILANDQDCYPVLRYVGGKPIVWVKYQYEIEWYSKPPKSLLNAPLADWEPTIIT